MRRLVAVSLAGLVLLGGCTAAGTGRVLSGAVFDRRSGLPVHQARVSFGGRSTTLFTTREFRLTSLAARDGMLTVDAPGYAEQSRPLRLEGRETRVEVGLEGREVPGLAGILVWGQREGGALRLDVRLTDAGGAAIERFPFLDFGAEVRILENVGSDSAPERGRLLYSGRPELYLDPSSRFEKLKCRIDMGELEPARHGVQAGVLDFVLHSAQGDFSWTRGDIPLR